MGIVDLLCVWVGFVPAHSHISQRSGYLLRTYGTDIRCVIFSLLHSEKNIAVGIYSNLIFLKFIIPFSLLCISVSPS